MDAVETQETSFTEEEEDKLKADEKSEQSSDDAAAATKSTETDKAVEKPEGDDGQNKGAGPAVVTEQPKRTGSDPKHSNVIKGEGVDSRGDDGQNKGAEPGGDNEQPHSLDDQGKGIKEGDAVINKESRTKVPDANEREGDEAEDYQDCNSELEGAPPSPQTVPKEYFQVRNVKLTPSQKIPSRQISVKWKKTEYKGNDLNIHAYIVYLTDGDNKKTESQIVKDKRKCKFTSLKSNAAYIAHIVSITQEGAEIATTLSDPLTTAKANRIPEFKIETEGKVNITKCKAVHKDNLQTGKLAWKLPDLGNEKHNYITGPIQAFVAAGSEEKRVCRVIDKCKIEPIGIESGKTYTFTIVCSYTDIDQCKAVTAVTTSELKTTIQCPVIEGVEFGEKIVVKWAKGQGAKGHNLKILYSNEEIWSKPNLSQDVHSIDIDESLKMHYGKMCTFVLQATAANGFSKVGKKEVLLGGTSVTSDVIAIAGKRSVTVNWKSPQDKPDSYMVEILEGINKKLSKDFKLEDSSIVTHTFTDLKSNTKYFCKVYPIFKTRKGNATVSNTVTTEKRGAFVLEQDEERFGKATKIIHKFFPDDEVLLSWQSPNIGPNFKIIKYDVTLMQHTSGWISSSKKMDGKQLCANTLDFRAKGISKGSKYTFTITSLIQDLDKTEPTTNQTEYIFTKEPSPTTINDCVCKNGLITFSWERVDGATTYELKVVDQDKLNDLVPKKTTAVSKENDACSVEFQSDDNLRVGRYCMAKVTAYANDQMSQSEYKLLFIGGQNVVKNVTATQNKEDPQRSVDIVFDRPQAKAAEHQYQIVAIPSASFHGSGASSREGKRLKFCRAIPLVFLGKRRSGEDEIDLAKF